MSYPDIAKKLHLPVSTVFTALKRYKEDGYRFVNRRRLNFRRAWAKQVKIKGPLKEYLLSDFILNEWASLSLP
jgi:transposase